MSKPTRTPHDPNRPLGHKNPSKETQFKKGNPGGPGRPKGQTNVGHAMSRMFGGKVPVNVNGKTIQKPMAEAIAKRGQQLMLTGSATGFFRGLDLYAKYGPEIEAAKPQKVNMSILGPELVRFYLCILRKTQAYYKVDDGEDVEPMDAKLREELTGNWKVSFGEDGHIEMTRIE